jgi:HlyD family secretion protein
LSTHAEYTTTPATVSAVPPPRADTPASTRLPQSPKPRPANTKRRWRKLIPWLIVAAIVLAIALGLRPKPFPVEGAKVTEGPLTVSVLEEGKTRIRNRYTISPPIGGYLQRVPFRAGAKIEAGKTVLAEILPEPASLLNPRSQSEAEARVKATEAAVNQREADLDRARAANDLAARELQRALPLKKTGAISTREFDQADMAASMRGREQRSAEFALQVAQYELKQAEAALMQARGGPQTAGDPFQIVAPVNGYVLNVFEESARIVPPGHPVMEVGDPTDLEAEIELLSTDAAGVMPGAPALIERWGGPNPLKATVSLVEPAAFTKISALGVEEQRVKVRVQFNDPPPKSYQLGDRYRVEARITTWSSPEVLQLPTGALFRRGGDWMCFVAAKGEAQLRKVEVGHNNGLAAEVLAGLKLGETVIIHPPDVVTEGARITLQ